MTYEEPLDWDEEESSDEYDAEDTTITCPECQAEIYEDSERCPACGYYLSSSERYGSHKPTWVFVTAVLLLLWMLYALLG